MLNTQEPIKMNLQNFIRNATELANTIVDSGLYEGTSVYEMAQEILENSEPNLDDAAKKYYSNTNRIILVWGTDDIQHQAEGLNIELSDSEAMDILTEIENKHDASIGVNWGVISEYIRMHHSYE